MLKGCGEGSFAADCAPAKGATTQSVNVKQANKPRIVSSFMANRERLQSADVAPAGWRLKAIFLTPRPRLA